MARIGALDMPFGAQVTDNGSVRFRLWAPAQTTVAVALEDTDRALPMTALPDGWFELVTDAAQHGTPYRFQLGDGFRVPDPASRCQCDDAHGPSMVVDPRATPRRVADWRGRPWHETVLYELNVGAATPDGGFAGVRRQLDALARLGITAVELMPVADFPGRRNWGYDGVLPFAPDRAYGAPDDLKELIDAAHERDLMVFLDVVYNHFGPDGNYLHLYAPQFFDRSVETPWGAAIDFTRRPVRDFFIANALYWLQEYGFDGLRFDAVHAIVDPGPTHILEELADTVRSRLPADRHVHLVLENDKNEARFLGQAEPDRAVRYDAQWNDDVHHVLHVLLTGETNGYYEDYADDPAGQLATALSTGYVYQGQPSRHRNDAPRGEPSGHLPPTRFVNFIQNHDQIGNRAFGERLTRLAPPDAVRAAQALLLLAPQIPMLFMAEHWGAETPFLFFCDFHDDLADAVREGRRREFASFPEFADPATRSTIPDPNAVTTWLASCPGAPTGERTDWLENTRTLLDLRRREIMPRLAGIAAGSERCERWGDAGLTVAWRLGDGARLTLVANLSGAPDAGCGRPPGRTLYETTEDLADKAAGGTVPAFAVGWFVETLN